MRQPEVKATASRELQIPMTIEELQRAISRLEGTIASLAERLEPVSSKAEMESKEVVKGDRPEPCLVPMAERLQDMVNKVNIIEGYVRYSIERLEL